MNQTENKVKIEGILSEINVREGEFKQKTTNVMMPYLSGDIKVRVKQVVNKVPTEEEVPISFFVTKYKKDGGENPAYKSVNDLRNNFISLAAAETPEQADCVRITLASIRENMFYGRDGRFVSMPQINSSFFNKISRTECTPDASFQAVICIGNIKEEIDKNGDPTGSLIIQGILPQYGGKVDVADFYVRSPEAVDFISTNWKQGDTVRIAGKVNFSATTTYTEEEMGFGEPVITPHTVSVRELIITSGSPSGFEGDMALDTNEIAAALQERQQRILTLKKNSEATKTTNNSNAAFNALGF